MICWCASPKCLGWRRFQTQSEPPIQIILLGQQGGGGLQNSQRTLPMLPQQVMRAMESALPEKSTLRLSGESLSKVAGLATAFVPHHYAQKENETFCFLEQHGLPCLRLQREGTKTVVVAMYGELVDYMTKHTKIAKAAVTREKVCEFLRGMTQEDLYSFTTSAARIWHGTLGACDLFYVPPNAVVAEAVLPKQDVVGLKLNTIVAGAGAVRADLEEQAGVANEVQALLASSESRTPSGPSRPAGSVGPAKPVGEDQVAKE